MNMCKADNIVIKFLVIIPVYNPDDKFKHLLQMLQKQSLADCRVLLIDSGIHHEYMTFIKNNSRFIIKKISGNEFNHGGTRQLAMDLYPNYDVYVFLTQDAILANEKSIENLISCFNDSAVGCAYGRQLPYDNASFFSQIARFNNYGEKSYIRTFNDRKKYGLKTCFISNSFAAYRKEAMLDVYGFPTNTILSEDMCVAAKMLKKGWMVAYNADAQVYHSHNYSILQEFKRYFDIGVFHARESWICDSFGQAEGNGMNFVKNEIRAIMRKNPLLIFEMIVRDGMKFIGYRLGRQEAKLPVALKQHISMTRKYWC